MVDAVRSEELVEHSHIAAEPEFVQDALDDGLVLSERHVSTLQLKVVIPAEQRSSSATMLHRRLESVCDREQLS
jgi:hypothetical protein